MGQNWHELAHLTCFGCPVCLPITGLSSLLAIPAIALADLATSLNRTTVARAIAAPKATALRSVAVAIANKYVMRNIDQSNGEKAFRISPTSFNITLLIGWFYQGRIPNNGTSLRHKLYPRLSPLTELAQVISLSSGHTKSFDETQRLFKIYTGDIRKRKERKIGSFLKRRHLFFLE